MGLDMYIYARKETLGRVVKDAELSDEFLKDLYGKYGYISKPKDLKVFDNGDLSKTATIKVSYNIGYFRKFNALHNFLTNSCGRTVGVNDNCVDMLITEDIIDDLIDRLTRIVKVYNRNQAAAEYIAEAELPTQDGFFFGSTAYDDGYFEDCEDALDLFTKMKELIVSAEEEGEEPYEFYYQAWY